MNKKGKFEMDVRKIIAIVFLTIVFVWSVISIGKAFFEISPEYKIEKEVCWNEVIYVNSGEVVFKNDTTKQISGVTKCKPGDASCYVYYEALRDVCEMQEVDEIRTWQDPTSGVSPVNCSNLNEGAESILNSDGFFCKDEIVQRMDIYSKKDLTKEWLFQNAVCDILPKGFGKDGTFTNDEVQKECVEWKLGDYYISEVGK